MDRNPVTRVTAGLDLSLTSTGFCLKAGINITVDTIKTKPKQHPNDLARLCHIRDEIMKRLPENVSMVCVEDVFTPTSSMRVRAAMNLTMLAGVIRTTLWEAGIPFYVPTSSQLKKFATGKGVGQKSIIVREVFKRWGVEVTDDNQADATVLAYMAQAIVDPSTAKHKYQQDTLKKILKDRPRYNV